MVRVLHLLGRDSLLDAAHGSEMLIANRGADGAFSLRIGRGEAFRNAAEAALRLRFQHAFNLIHAWDSSALIAAVGSGLPVVFSPSTPLRRGTWSWLAAMAYHDVHVVADSDVSRARHLRIGIPPDRCHFIRPGLQVAQGKQTPPSILREELGLSAEDRIVLAPGESIPAFGHKLALHSISILHVLDQRYRLVVWGRGPLAIAIETLARRLRQPGLVVNVEARLGHVEFKQLLSISDVALLTPPNIAPVLPTAMCAAAGIPIVAVDTPLLREVFTDQEAVLVPADSPRRLAQAVMGLIEYPEMRSQFAQAARATAARFPPAEYVKAYSALYRRLADPRQSPISEDSPTPVLSPGGQSV